MVTWLSRRERIGGVARRVWGGVDGGGQSPCRRWFGRWRSNAGCEWQYGNMEDERGGRVGRLEGRMCVSGERVGVGEGGVSIGRVGICRGRDVIHAEDRVWGVW